MTNLIGEYECRLDPKGRVQMPVALRDQVGSTSQNRYVLLRGFEECLVLYPLTVWNELVAEIKNNYDPFDEDHRQFLRYFFRGATEVKLDGTSRLLIPKNLLDYAGIEKDLVMFAVLDHIEIWRSEAYGKTLSKKPNEVSKLAKEVMGRKKQQSPDHVS